MENDQNRATWGDPTVFSTDNINDSNNLGV